MALRVGARLGPYEVLGVIGAGGMGEVYRARDTDLQRDVALKVLPEALAGHPRRLLRFEREARVLAALNHPNIATVYGIAGAGPGHGRAIAMELVEGEDLSLQIRRGPMALAEALHVARQVAGALSAAHDAGIVHRDLKPANIKVRPDGTVKVLDFGLAQHDSADPDRTPASGPGAGSHDLAPTLTGDNGLTQDGAVLGTAAYMAPEQAKGTSVDKRADIWAFGVVLFEMLSGRRPFHGAEPAEPEWPALPSRTPATIRRLLARCLARDRKQRIHDIADARLEIDEALSARAPEADSGATRLARRWPMGVAGVLAGLAIGVVWTRSSPAPQPVTYARIDVAPASSLDTEGIHPRVVLPRGGARTAIAWSPDGRTIGFIGIQDGQRRIYLRDLAAAAARPLDGTEGAQAIAFSPTGEEVAYWANGAINRIRVTGGPPARICAATFANGLTWGATRIVFSQGSLWAVDLPSSGSEAYALAHPPELVRVASPFLLPGDQSVLYTEYQKQWTSGDERVMVQAIGAGATPRVVLEQAADARYLSTGHLTFLRQGTLFVVPFDVTALKVRGEPVPVIRDVAQAVVAWDSDDLTLEGQYAISPGGMLAYVSSPLPAPPDNELVSVDRTGRVTPIGAPLRGYKNHVDVSPDGARIAVSVQTTSDVWVFLYDLAHGRLSRIATSLKGELLMGAWTRDQQIAVSVIDQGRVSAALVGTDPSAAARPLPDSTGFWPSSVSRDGRIAGMSGGDIWVHAPPESAVAPVAMDLTLKVGEVQPMWSPDGRLIAYASNATGRSEVYVKPFPGPGEALLVSTNGGASPAWHPNGAELFYVEPGRDEDRMMAVVVNAAAAERLGRPRGLFAFERGALFTGSSILTPYAVAPDGRFYTVRPRPRQVTPVTEINVVLHWFEALRARIPPG